jgi:hypothetical protein
VGLTEKPWIPSKPKPSKRRQAFEFLNWFAVEQAIGLGNAHIQSILDFEFSNPPGGNSDLHQNPHHEMAK